MKKSTKQILFVSGVAALTATVIGAVYHTVAKELVGIALDRKEPKNIQKGKARLRGSKKLSEAFDRITTASEKLALREHEKVEIINRDGLRLVGHWYVPDNPKRVIIAMHGWRSSWSQDFGAISEFWENNDCCVLYAEQRGQGGSDGEYMGFGLLERYDCLEWINWVITRTDGKLPIYLGGMSMGASTVLMTAGFELPENVHGIVADCGFTSPRAIWKHVVENNLHIPYRLYGSVANKMCRRRIQVGSDAYSCVDAMKACKVPVMFIHGTDDHFVPISMTYENYRACTAPKRLFVVPGAEHGMSYLVDKDGYEAAVRTFWKDYDRVGS